MLAERWSHAVGELPPTLPRDTEIDVLLSGRMRVERQGPSGLQSMAGRRGTVGISPAGICEEYINIREPAEDCLHIFLSAKPFADVVLQDLDLDPARATLRYEMVEYDPLIEQIALAISRELTAQTSAGRLLIEALGNTLSAYLVHRYSDAALSTNPFGTAVRPMDHRRMARVLDFIDAHIDQDFTVADMAAVACMSPAHFARSFKARTGQSPHRFVSKKRLGLAERMLLDPYRPMSDIALSTGFSSQSNFSRAFRNVNGMSPGDYRASQNQDSRHNRLNGTRRLDHCASLLVPRSFHSPSPWRTWRCPPRHSQVLNENEQSRKSAAVISTIGSYGSLLRRRRHC
jgi:AraC family transcriptional regulator